MKKIRTTVSAARTGMLATVPQLRQAATAT